MDNKIIIIWEHYYDVITFIEFHNHISNLTSILERNGYKYNFINSTINDRQGFIYAYK